MARKALNHTPTPADDGFDPEKLEAAGQAAMQLGEMQRNYGQGRDLVNQLLGQAQGFRAAGNLLQTFGVSKLAIVKENKLYQQLAGMRTPNGLELKGTWTEFCELLGISDEKANQDIANLQAFGEEALDQMQRVGIGYRDLRQFRKLPADQRVALIEAAKEGDKDTLLELAEDLIAKHTKEKDTLIAELGNAKADNDAKDAVLDGMQKKLTSLQLQLKKKIVADTDWPDALVPITDQIAAAGRAIAKAISDFETCRITLMETGQALEADLQPKYEAALVHVAEVYETALAKAERNIQKERVTFDKSLGMYADPAVPGQAS